MTLRNQTRYNRTHREAVVSAIQNVAAFNPATDLVTIARQGNERENSIFSNQTSLTDRFTTGRPAPCGQAGVEISREEQFAPTLTGLGTRHAGQHLQPEPHDPSPASRRRARWRRATAEPTTDRRLRVRHGGAQFTGAGVGRVPLGPLRHRLPRTSMPPGSQTTDLLDGRTA